MRHKIWIGLVFATGWLLTGCQMTAKAPAPAGLEGNWSIYTPFSTDPGTIEFHGNNFDEDIKMSMGSGDVDVKIAGDFKVNGNSLDLNPTSVKSGDSNNPLTNILGTATLKNRMSFTMDRDGSDLIYLDSGASNQNGSVNMTYALARNGATPDKNRASLTIESTGTSGGSTGGADATTGSAITGGSTNGQDGGQVAVDGQDGGQQSTGNSPSDPGAPNTSTHADSNQGQTQSNTPQPSQSQTQPPGGQDGGAGSPPTNSQTTG